MPTPSAYDVISTQLPKWWKSLQNRPQDFTIADAADIALPHSVSDAAMMAMTGGLGKVANIGLGALAAATYAGDAEAGMLNPKIGALGKLMRMLGSHNAVLPPQVLQGLRDTSELANRNGEAFLINNGRDMHPAMAKAYPSAQSIYLDTSGFNGGGADLYKTFYNSLSPNDIVQASGPLSPINAARKSVNMANAAATNPAIDLGRIAYNPEQTLHVKTASPYLKAFSPSDIPESMDLPSFLKLDPDEKLGWLGYQQAAGSEDALSRFLPDVHKDWLDTSTVPSDAASRLHSNIDNTYTANQLARQKALGLPDSPVSPFQLQANRVGDTAAAYGQNSLDQSKLYLQSLITPESYHPELLDDYLSNKSLP